MQWPNYSSDQPSHVVSTLRISAWPELPHLTTVFLLHGFVAYLPKVSLLHGFVAKLQLRPTLCLYSTDLWPTFSRCLYSTDMWPTYSSGKHCVSTPRICGPPTAQAHIVSLLHGSVAHLQLRPTLCLYSTDLWPNCSWGPPSPGVSTNRSSGLLLLLDVASERASGRWASGPTGVRNEKTNTFHFGNRKCGAHARVFPNTRAWE